MTFHGNSQLRKSDPINFELIVAIDLPGCQSRTLGAVFAAGNADPQGIDIVKV
jgi:hypothetical protein